MARGTSDIKKLCSIQCKSILESSVLRRLLHFYIEHSFVWVKVGEVSNLNFLECIVETEDEGWRNGIALASPFWSHGYGSWTWHHMWRGPFLDPRVFLRDIFPGYSVSLLAWTCLCSVQRNWKIEWNIPEIREAHVLFVFYQSINIILLYSIGHIRGNNRK